MGTAKAAQAWLNRFRAGGGGVLLIDLHDLHDPDFTSFPFMSAYAVTPFLNE
jgi:hypothetical protein